MPLLQAPKPQASKEAKALAATNSSKGKKKVRCWTVAAPRHQCYSGLGLLQDLSTFVMHAEMVQGKDEGEGQQPSPLRPGKPSPAMPQKWLFLQARLARECEAALPYAHAGDIR